MKNKGFTLIELLAVIVILAIIAIIATPKILDVVEESRKNAAESSALGYIDAVEKQLMINDLQSTSGVTAGSYSIEDLDRMGVKVSGKKPDGGTVVINNKGAVESASLSVNDYEVSCASGKCEAYKGTIVYRFSSDPLFTGDKIDLKQNKITNYKKLKRESVYVEELGGDTTKVSWEQTNETKNMTGIYSTDINDVLTITKAPNGTTISSKSNKVYLKHLIDSNGIVVKSEVCRKESFGELCLRGDQGTFANRSSILNYETYGEPERFDDKKSKLNTFFAKFDSSDTYECSSAFSVIGGTKYGCIISNTESYDVTTDGEVTTDSGGYECTTIVGETSCLVDPYQ